MSPGLRVLGAILVGSMPGPAAAAWTAGGECGRPLKEVRAEWKVEAAAPREACGRKEALWLELRRCYAGYGDWLPWLEEVTRCHLARGQLEAALAFYHRLLADSLRSLPCAHDGLTCGQFAAGELRRLACGQAWLAAEPQQAWTDVAGALRAPDRALPTAFHLEPLVDAGGDDPLSDLGCLAGAFAVPPAILRNAALIADAVAASSSDPLVRVVAVELEPEELGWTRSSGQRYLRMQVCPWTETLPSGGGYYVDLNLASNEERTVRKCQTAFSWMGRRVGLAR